NGQMERARLAYAQAAGLKPLDARSRAYYAASFVGNQWLQTVPSVKCATVSAEATPPALPPRNLVYDTWYGRTRASMSHAIHPIDNALSSSGTPRRVPFEA